MNRVPKKNELVAQAAMIAEWSGSSIREELIPGMGNMSALLWLNFGHARHGAAARIQVGVCFWLAVRKIRIPPLAYDPVVIPRSISSIALLTPIAGLVCHSGYGPYSLGPQMGRFRRTRNGASAIS